MIVPGGGISLDGTRWISCRPNYLLPVKVLSRLFCRLMLELLLAAHEAGRLQFFGHHAHLAGKAAFKAYLTPLHRTKWFVYSKRPFAGPEQVLAYLSRYTHRVAISNSRLIAVDATGVMFSYKDYRIEGLGRYKTMTLKPDEFIRRFLIHVLPTDSTASATMVCWPTAPAPTTSRGRVSDCYGATANTVHQQQPDAAAQPTRHPSVPVLRRSHDHYRDLQARLDTASSADRSNHRRQDRYVLTTTACCNDALTTLPSVGHRPAPTTLAQMRRPDI